MDRETAIRTLVTTIDAYLARFDGPGIAEVRAGIARWGNGPLVDLPPQRIKAVDHVDTALAALTAEGEAHIAETIAGASPHLHWLAYDPYPRDEIGDRYAENHAVAVVIGDGGPIPAEDFSLGVFGFASDTVYRDHHHAPPELYAPLTGPNGWRFASGEKLRWKPAHQPVWNEPWAQHAFKSGPVPFLCFYGWTRDVHVPAKMIVEPDWAELDKAMPEI